MKKFKIFFCGIGGVSMAKLALFCLKNGVFVYGSDIAPFKSMPEMQKQGVKVFIGQSENNLALTPDLFVYSSAIKSDNKEFLAARKMGIKTVDRAEFLNALLYNFKTTIGIAGCHGKTTTGFMVSNVLKSIGEKMFVNVGGEDVNLGDFTYTGNDYLVTEVCEYNKNINKITCGIAVVLNTDLDHAECYSGQEELLECYSAYLNRAQIKIVKYEEKEKLNISGAFFTFSTENKNADFYADNIAFDNGKICFTTYKMGEKIGNFNIKSICRHNVLNALATICVCDCLGVESEKIIKGLSIFNGVKRRMEVIGIKGDSVYICDYAHHPEEIEKSMSDIERVYSKDIVTVFQPHTFSRTKAFFNKYISVLGQLKNVLIYKTYPARENSFQGLSGFDLSLAIGCPYFEDEKKLSDEITRLNKKCVVFLGAGDIYDIAKSIYSSTMLT